MRSSKLNVVAGRFGKFLVMALLVLPLLPVVGLQGCALFLQEVGNHGCSGKARAICE